MNLLRLRFFLFLSFILVFGALVSSGVAAATLYYGDGCPHCAHVEAYLAQHPVENLTKKEIYHHPENAEEFTRLCDERNIKLMDRGVPFLAVGDQCYIGEDQIISYLSSHGEAQTTDVAEDVVDGVEEKLTLPLVIGAAIVDAVNPCAFAVLLILLMTILAAGRRRTVLTAGCAFSAAIFISYYLMGLGVYSVVASFRTAHAFMTIIGVIAIILGLLNLKDFFWYGKGFLMEVPLSWRPRLKKLLRSVTNPVGAFLIGFLVSLFLLPCTSGPYIVILSMLGHQVTRGLALRYLLLYNAVFVAPMFLITIATFFGLNVEKAEAQRVKSLRWLHLIAGIIMILMGVVILR